MTPEQAAELGKLDPEAIERVRSEAWPRLLNADELHDALVLLGFVDGRGGRACWAPLFERLRADGRATTVELPRAGAVWVSAERLPEVELALPGAVAAEQLAVARRRGAVDRDTALRELVRSRFEALGPVTAEALARPFGLRRARRAAGARGARAARRGDARQLHAARRGARSGASGGCSRAFTATR